MEKQITFGMLSDEMSQAKTSKKEFLNKIDKIIPWSQWVEIIRPCYFKGERGNKPYDIELMLRIYILQNLYDLSDMRVMTEVIDSRAFSDFCFVTTPEEVPDGDTIGRFRNILVQNNIQEVLFTHVVELLRKRGLILKKGTIVDSTIIEAPSSTKNARKERDPDAHQTKKGNMWHFGYKAHIGVDKDSGLVHHLKTTSANVHDVTQVNELINETDESVYGDSGYLGAEKYVDDEIKDKIDWNINLRVGKKNKLDENEKLAFEIEEYGKSTIRSKVEHVFGVVKKLFGYRKTRYRGLRKQSAKMNIMFALANLYLADSKKLTA